MPNSHINDFPVLAFLALHTKMDVIKKISMSDLYSSEESRAPIERLLGAISAPAPQLRQTARIEMGNDATTAKLDQFMRDAVGVKAEWTNLLYPQQRPAANVVPLGLRRPEPVVQLRR